MHGNVSVQTREGQGSIFTVSVPFKKIPREEPSEEQAAASLSELPKTKGQKILLVEDNTYNLMLAQKMLEKL